MPKDGSTPRERKRKRNFSCNGSLSPALTPKRLKALRLLSAVSSNAKVESATPLLPLEKAPPKARGVPRGNPSNPNNYVLKGSDITILVGEEQRKFCLHSSVICDHSLSIKREFAARLSCAKSKVISRSRVDPDAFEDLVNWMYAGRIPLSKDHMDHDHLKRYFSVIIELNMPKLGKDWFDEMALIVQLEEDKNRKFDIAHGFFTFLWEIYSDRYAAPHTYVNDLVWHLSPYLKISADTITGEHDSMPLVLKNAWIMAREKMVSRMCDQCIEKLYIDKGEGRCYVCTPTAVEKEGPVLAEESVAASVAAPEVLPDEFDLGAGVPYVDQNVFQNGLGLGDEYEFGFDVGGHGVINWDYVQGMNNY
ncbi:hypothetical protein TWF694_005769 [Orbilia ellipsospora]|uniref:BTB domain-containing protein n=1 Tax=Orbilia ellipsospora TaxID=2528407 RepID=A0AAV9WSX7_9PEZI